MRTLIALSTFISPCCAGGIVTHDDAGNRYVLFIGIIDILQSYVMKKKIEHTWKAMLHDGVRC